MNDDFDAPNTAPGMCPECGQQANIWDAIIGQWECSFCSWKGRNPNRNVDKDNPYAVQCTSGGGVWKDVDLAD